MNRSPLVRKSAVPVIVLVDEELDSLVRILQTGWKDRYSVIYEDALDSQECGHRFMEKDQILKEYEIDVERYFS